MIRALKKSSIAIVAVVIIVSCVVAIKKPCLDKVKAKNLIIVDRLVETLVC